jgi:hypothetical protein
MATYPNLPIDVEGSEQVPIDAIDVDEWPNGNARGRSYVTVGRYRWTLKHIVAEADRATIKAFYDSNRLRVDVSYVSSFDGATYNNILITSPPEYKPMPGGNWTVTVAMRQVV